MTQQSIATLIHSDLTEQRETYLKMLLVGCVILLGAMSPVLQNHMLFTILFLIVIALTFVLYQTRRTTLASFVFLYGLTITISVQLWVTPLHGFLYFLMLIPMILSNLFLEDRVLKGLVPLTIVLMVVIPILQEGIVAAFNLSAAPVFVCLILAVTTILSTRNIMRIVEWATDSQQKDARRAEVFYEQREELKRTLLELSHANSKLEHLNEELEKAQKWAEQASQAKTIFISNMSHELRTPLNVVIGYSSSMLQTPEMYDNQPLADVYKRDIQLIQDNGTYLVSLINDILDLSKIESNKLELHYATVNMADLMQGVIATSIGLVKDKSVQLILDTSTQIPPLWADPRRVRQILLNLMSNAAKFTRFGSITMHSRIEGKMLYVSVTDTGIGIPEKALIHIFDRYEQATHDTDKQFGGTGLGLDISKHLSEMHGGDLTVKSREGEGSTFTLSLPLIEPPRDLQAVETDSNTVLFEEFDEVDLQDVMIILLVEHEVSLRNSLQRTLQEKDFMVINAHETTNVVDMALDAMPNMIVIDADEDGWAIWDDLKACEGTASIPMVVYGQSNLRHEPHFIPKPITPNQLITLISEVRQ